MEFAAATKVSPLTSLSSTDSGAGPDLNPTHAGGGGLAPVKLSSKGRVDYEPTWRAMQAFTAGRQTDTPDELWIVEHPPVYTVGLAGRPEHFPREMRDIPLVKTDRGGQITYHGPGQAVVYTLVDLARRAIKVRDMVCLLEQAVIDVLAEQGIAAERRSGAPGVYIASGPRGGLHGGAKIAALGLKVKRGGCYHGVSLNVDLDLSPFNAIDPCGYPGMPVTSLRDMGSNLSLAQAGEALAAHIAAALERNPQAMCK